MIQFSWCSLSLSPGVPRRVLKCLEVSRAAFWVSYSSPVPQTTPQLRTQVSTCVQIGVLLFSTRDRWKAAPRGHEGRSCEPLPSKTNDSQLGCRLSLSGIRGSNSRPSAWEADALPTELIPQLWLKKAQSLILRLGDPHRIQTCNLLIRSQMLYSVELGDHIAG